MIRTACSLRILLIAVVAMGSCVGVVQAQLWRNFVPGLGGSDSPRGEPDSGSQRAQAALRPANGATALAGDYALAQESGPWLIVAASFSGEGAVKQAQDLASELRERHRLRTYLHEMNFQLGDESPGRGLDAYGAPVRRRYQRGDRVHEYAVLVGDFPAIDDPGAQQALERIKGLQPEALNVDAGTTAQTMAHMRRMEDALMEKLGKPRKRGPMAQAFLTRNPLLPREFFVPKGVDPFVAKMNEGVEHSLLDCPGRYTVQVATFRGKTILQTSANEEKASPSFWNRRKRDDHNPLMEAAENAHLLTEELRSHGFEAYEFHDRSESIVTIGSFAQVVQPLPDGRALPSPAVQKIIETFGAAYNTPADPLSNIGNDLATQQRVQSEMQRFNLRVEGQQSPAVQGLNPKHVKIMRGSGKRKRTHRIIPMDVYPHAIEAPKRSISSAYAG